MKSIPSDSKTGLIGIRLLSIKLRRRSLTTAAGLHETADGYYKIAAEECGRMEDALRAVAVENEPNPAKSE